MELNRDQIIKALECCSKDDCDNCPNPFGNCYANLAGYALALIKELTEENERLMDECGNQSVLWKQHFESIFQTAKETVKADTVREMQGRFENAFGELTEYFNEESYESLVVSNSVLDLIDQIAKEMVEGIE